MQTIRQKIIALLEEQQMDARSLSQALSIQEKEVYTHLSHVSRSIAIKNKKLIIEPCKCLSCGFIFKDRKRFTRPGKCPRCRQTHLQSPSYRII